MVPVGMQEGIKILVKTSGNIIIAADLFKEKRVKEIQAKMDVSEVEALTYLQENDYEIAATLREIEQNQYTFIERVLRSNKKAATKLSIITLALADKLNLERDLWIKQESLSQLNIYHNTVLGVSEWLDYCGWEGIDVAINLQHTPKIIKQLDENLNEEKSAQILKKLISRIQELWRPWNREKLRKTNFNRYIEVSNELCRDPEYNKLINDFDLRISKIVESLLDYIRKNKEEFDI